MAELQYVPLNQAVLPPFCAYDPACLLPHLFKLKIFLNLNVGEHPFSCILARLLLTMLYHLFVFSLCANLL